jgi:hypothetical protein
MRVNQTGSLGGSKASMFLNGRTTDDTRYTYRAALLQFFRLSQAPDTKDKELDLLNNQYFDDDPPRDHGEDLENFVVWMNEEAPDGRPRASYT